jgi:hypothetical protein
VNQLIKNKSKNGHNNQRPEYDPKDAETGLNVLQFELLPCKYPDKVSVFI